MSNPPGNLEQIGDGRFSAQIDGDWSFGERVNSGYLQRVAAQAAVAVVPHHDPIAVTTDFLTTVHGGPAQLITEPLRLGNSIDVVRVTMRQADETVLVSSVVVGTLEGKPADMDMSVSADVPSPDQCTRIESDTLRGRRLPLMDRVEIRLAPECIPLLRGQGDGSFALRGWARLVESTDGPDPLDCLALVDAFPPVRLRSAATAPHPPCSSVRTFGQHPYPAGSAVSFAAGCWAAAGSIKTAPCATRQAMSSPSRTSWCAYHAAIRHRE
ncbi:MAG: acyl-CoA thioesterase domain-containing protein [Mycobacteriales bacterium]